MLTIQCIVYTISEELIGNGSVDFECFQVEAFL